MDMGLTWHGKSATGQMAIDIKQTVGALLSGDSWQAQFIRYAVTGAAITALQAAVYWGLAGPAGLNPQLANFVGYLAAVASGYVLHGRFSFRSDGERTTSSTGQAIRFMAVSLLSLALNAIWVWLCVTHFKLPLWTPIPLMAIVTPALVFVLNRQWVFR